MNIEIISPRKLIEVALPLDAINEACANEKQPFTRRHPRSIHIWWARRPLAAARAVVFSQIVNDPEDLWRCQNPGIEPKPQHKSHWTKRRAELFRIIEAMVKWENNSNEKVLNDAREEIRKAWRETCELNKCHPQATELFDPLKMPALHDPFAGGGAIPLEAQRLGIEAYASDLNPVAVLINKAMIEIPQKFAGKSPVCPSVDTGKQKELIASTSEEWIGAKGLAEDVRYYGQWIREEAFKRIGNLYPPVEITAEMATVRPHLKPYVGERLSVIGCLWARTVKSPSPAYSSMDVPLVSTFILSSKEGKEAYVEPVISESGYTFKVKDGTPPVSAKDGTKAARANFRCLFSNAIIDTKYIRQEAQQGRMGTRLMAVIADGTRCRVYLSPSEEQSSVAAKAHPSWKPDLRVTTPCHDVDRLPMYGMYTWGDAFTPRQLVALTTLSDLIGEVRERIRKDAIAAGTTDDDRGLDAGGTGARAYAEAISVYLSTATSRWADLSNSICSWNTTNQNVRALFARQAIPMNWDYVELSPFSSVGPWFSTVESTAESIANLPVLTPGHSLQANASNQGLSRLKFVSTDPPYYDNIGYAELSDFFYVWLRPTLQAVFPTLFENVSVPKAEELVAASYRHGSKIKAEQFFLDGMTLALKNLATQSHPAAPITIYYAFKQSETEDQEGTSSTGWETFLDAVLKAGLSITGTWPMRTERAARSTSIGTNALASSIVLVCRRRNNSAATISRRQFSRQLNETLPLALDAMTRESEGLHSPVAPVDLSQAIIGPGMAIFSKFSAVIEADGKPMSVKTALQLINRFLSQDDFDHDTQFCLSWFDGYGWDQGKFGEADVLARAKGTSVDGLRECGVIESGAGTLRLLRANELPKHWRPESDSRLSVWELLHHMIRSLNSDGESGAGNLLSKTARYSENVRTLAYRLYTVCERKGWAQDAGQYNSLVLAWDAIEASARSTGFAGTQISLFEEQAGQTTSEESKKRTRKKK